LVFETGSCSNRHVAGTIAVLRRKKGIAASTGNFSGNVVLLLFLNRLPDQGPDSVSTLLSEETAHPKQGNILDQAQLPEPDLFSTWEMRLPSGHARETSIG
jgi:hypothetical protein